MSFESAASYEVEPEKRLVAVCAMPRALLRIARRPRASAGPPTDPGASGSAVSFGESVTCRRRRGGGGRGGSSRPRVLKRRFSSSSICLALSGWST